MLLPWYGEIEDFHLRSDLFGHQLFHLRQLLLLQSPT